MLLGEAISPSGACIDLLPRLQASVPNSRLLALLSPFLDAAEGTPEEGEERLRQAWQGLWQLYGDPSPMPEELSSEKIEMVFTKCLEEMRQQLTEAKALDAFRVGM